MSESCDQVLEHSKEHGEESKLKQGLSENHVELQKNEKDKELTDAFFVDLLNNSSSESDSDIISSPNSKSFDVGDSDSLLNSSCDVNQNSETVKKILSFNSVEQHNEIVKETIQHAVNEVSMNEIESCVKNVASDIISEIETSSLQLDAKKSESADVNYFNGHRETEEWTDDESASSTSSSDSSGDDFFDELHRVATPKIVPVKTKGELDIEDLPPIEELNISVEKSELTKVGKVHAVVSKQVVVQAMKDQTPLDMDSVLFLSENEPLGRIFEVFGPVVEPFYVVLFNSTEDITKKNIQVGTEVYFAPKKQDITMYVFLDALRQQKGSDASWADNNEPPEEFLDYSDDEQERIAKLKRRAKNRTREDDDEIDIVYAKSSAKIEGSLSDSKRNTSISQKNLNSMRNSSENTARYNHSTKQVPKNSVSSENIRCSSNRPYSTQNTNSLDNVPVWISSPPSFLEVAPMSSSPINVHNTSPLQSLNFPQTSTLSHPKLERSSPVSNNASQFRIPQVQLRPPVFHTMQPFIPNQAANVNAAPVYLPSLSSLQSSHRINIPSHHSAMVSQSSFMPNHLNNNNTYSPQTPTVYTTQSSLINSQRTNIQSSHIPLQIQKSPMSSNYRQPYVFGQVTPMPIVSPIPFSFPVQNHAVPMHAYVTTPPPHMSGSHQWQQRESQKTPPLHISGTGNYQWQQREALQTSALPISGNAYHQWQQRESQKTPALPISGSANHQWQQREALQTLPLSLSDTTNHQWQQSDSLRTQAFNSPLRVQIPSFTSLPPVVRFGTSNACPIPPPKPPSHQNHQFSSRF